MNESMDREHDATHEGRGDPGAGTGSSPVTIEAEVRALREDIAALRETITTPRRRTAVPQVLATPQQEQIARDLRDRLIRSEEELTRLRRQLQGLQRNLDAAETQRRRLLESRTWKLGKVTANVVMTPANTAKSFYGWLLRVLPSPANRALRQLVAGARGGRSAPARTGSRPAATARRGGPLVPIPVHGPEGVGAPLTSPAVLLVAYGLDESASEQLVEYLNDFRGQVEGLRVLVVTDCTAFHVFRGRQMLFEYLPSRQAWERQEFERTYDEFRRARFSELLRVYAPDRILHITSIDDLRAIPPALFSAA